MSSLCFSLCFVCSQTCCPDSRIFHVLGRRCALMNIASLRSRFDMTHAASPSFASPDSIYSHNFNLYRAVRDFQQHTYAVQSCEKYFVSLPSAALSFVTPRKSKSGGLLAHPGLQHWNIQQCVNNTCGVRFLRLICFAEEANACSCARLILKLEVTRQGRRDLGRLGQNDFQL